MKLSVVEYTIWQQCPFLGRVDKSSIWVFTFLWYLLHLLHDLHSEIWIFSSVPLNNEDHAAKASCHGRNHLLWRVTCELWMSSLCLWSQSTGKILKVSGKPTMLPRSPSWMRICILMHSETLGIHFQRTGFERKKYNSIWIKMQYGEVEKGTAESCHLWQISKVYHYFYPLHGIFVTVVGEAAVRQEITFQRVRCQICIIVWHAGRILKVIKNWTLNRLVFAEISCLVICLQAFV